LGKAMLAEKTQRFRCLRVHFIDWEVVAVL
jgi:hypothetical protein